MSTSFLISIIEKFRSLEKVDASEKVKLARRLSGLTGSEVYEKSPCIEGQLILALAKRRGQKLLVVAGGRSSSLSLEKFSGDLRKVGEDHDFFVKECLLSHASACAVREVVALLRPVALGTSCA